LIKIPGKKIGLFVKEAATALQCEFLEEVSKCLERNAQNQINPLNK
jgi:hypothetical protein